MIRDLLAVGFVLLGAFFFFAGTLGLLRFPDAFCRLHALSKADNAGLGFVVLGLLVRTTVLLEAVQLLAVWGLALLAGGVGSQLIATTIPKGRP
ncbi:cation:proton antiporter [Vulgatibacter sp.]|uniref:cation:proton antiporter n=1 Tax=Vulgatibacter sp. TaxID=1971226 RepID=UPI0035679F09